MSFDSLLQQILGPYGVLVVLCIIVVILYREWRATRAENDTLRAAIDTLQEERLKDAKSAEMLAKAYLSLREQEMPR